MDIVEQLKREEGMVLHVYDDATGKPITKGSKVIGYPTIGIGRMVDASKGGSISEDEAEMLLVNDLGRIRKELAKNIPWMIDRTDMNEPREAVLIGMAFQMGVSGLMAFKNMLALVRQGKYMAASNEMLASKWAEQTPNRAQRLAKQMATGQWQ